MPYAWMNSTTAPERSGATAEGGENPLAELLLWPHRSLPQDGFVAFIATTAVFISLPLLSVLGTPVLWGLLPFLVLAVAGMWWALRVTYQSGEVREELRLWPDRMSLIRSDPRRPARRWDANPFWVRTNLHATGGPVPNYLTLSGAGRVVEIGAFLSEDERVALQRELDALLVTLAATSPDSSVHR